MKRTPKADRPFLDRMRLRMRRALVCSVCDHVFRRTGTWDDHMSSPLVGYVTLDTCPDCRSRRAVYPEQAAWFAACFVSDGPTIPPDAPNWKWLEEAVTIDGGTDNGRSWPAIHVYENGSYVPFRQWLNSDLHVAADAVYRDALRLKVVAGGS